MEGIAEIAETPHADVYQIFFLGGKIILWHEKLCKCYFFSFFFAANQISRGLDFSQTQSFGHP